MIKSVHLKTLKYFQKLVLHKELEGISKNWVSVEVLSQTILLKG